MKRLLFLLAALAVCTATPAQAFQNPLPRFFKSIVAPAPTYVIEDMVKVLSWYDNETGYSHRMVDLAAMVGKEL